MGGGSKKETTTWNPALFPRELDSTLLENLASTGANHYRIVIRHARSPLHFSQGFDILFTIFTFIDGKKAETSKTSHTNISAKTNVTNDFGNL